MLSVLFALQLAAVAQADPFTFLQPTVTITAADRTHLDCGEPIAHVLPTQDLEVAVAVVVPVHIDGDRLVMWIREIEQLKRSSYVLAIHRFSNPPRIRDLDGLTLDESDLSEIRSCSARKCGLKLTSEEIRLLQQASASAGAAWRSAVEQRFRELMLARVQSYVTPPGPFAKLLTHSEFLSAHAPEFDRSLRSGRPMAGAESFLYWSKERLAKKAVISITDVTILRGRDPVQPDVLIAAKQIFATHYIDASLGVTVLLRGQGGTNYLAYVNRSEVDALGGLFGGLTRFMIQHRLRADAVDVLERLRRRLESGEPPAR